MSEEKEEGSRAFDPHLARRLFHYLRPYRFRATLSVVLVILSSALEVMGPAIIGVAIDLYVRPLGGAAPVGVSARIGAWLASHGWVTDAIRGINVATVLYLITLVGGFAILYTQMVLMNLMGQFIMYDLRKQIFGHLQKLDIQFFDRNPVGRLMTRVTTDVDALNEMFTAGFVAIFGDIFVLVGIVGVLFWLNWRLALVLFSITPFIILVSIWFRSGARRTYRAVRSRIAAINAFLQEHISGMSTVQLFNREEQEAAKFDVLNAKHKDANIESIFYYAVFYPVIELIQSIGIALIIWYGGGQVLRGTLTIGALIAFFQYAQRFYEPISDLSEKYNILQAAMAASERIFKLLDTKPKIEDGGTRELTELESIEFRNVCFAYNEPEWVLKNVSFRVERGQRIALVGHTGAGKTTVTSLLLRFYEPQRGEILINGIDIREYPLSSLRRLFAIVQQDFFLFTGTVEQNISLGDPDITPEAVRESALRVQADRFISRLPEGYAATVRERGAGFSVGEKQLLSFARALAFNPPVLILDEATSSIDTETERLIQQAIETLLPGRTSHLIAHRLSTIRSADEILVFHHGEIRERGTHEELMATNGLYRKLYEIQYREDSTPHLLPSS
ncbi:MAG: ABC-type multidrug transport system, ATPase and permease component [Acidobacteria bacterium]|nr:ABC-type multidrug transport system, ATPase and permease component [Acidobacteriota bacterium]